MEIKFTVCYERKGYFSTVYEEENKTVRSEEEMDRTFAQMFSLLNRHDFWQYSFKVSIGEGCWVVTRDQEDVRNRVYTVTYWPRWNSCNADEKMSRKQIREVIMEVAK